MTQDSLETASPQGAATSPGKSRLVSVPHVTAWLERKVRADGDDDEAIHRKVQLSRTLMLTIPSAVAWAAMYFAYDEPVAGAIPLAYSVLTLADLVLFLQIQRFRLLQRVQLALIIVAPFLLQLSLGGFAPSSAVIVWSFLAVLTAVLFGGREARWWFGAFLVELILAGVLQSHVPQRNNLPVWLVTAIFVLNLGVVATTAFLILESFLGDRTKLRELEVAYFNQELMLRQSEKLATLGTLAAGVAHELNNPAAAASRGVEQLRPLIEGMQRAYLGLWSKMSPGQTQSVERANAMMREQGSRVVSLSPLDRSDREDEIADWLEDMNVKGPAETAGRLVDLGFTQTQLEELTASLPPENVPPFLYWIAAAGEADKLLGEVGEGAERISQIVKAMKSYAYLDQAPVQNVDVVEGLESTLVLLSGKLREGILVQREYADGLPRIEAYGSELNQVWTNIIQNAIDAMEGSGNIKIRVDQSEGDVLVEIEDDGPGIPRGITDRVFDPFFTTKPPGSGTGLGLNISHNIVVQKHKGRIEVDSEPGHTVFRVYLPIRTAAESPAHASAR